MPLVALGFGLGILLVSGCSSHLTGADAAAQARRDLQQKLQDQARAAAEAREAERQQLELVPPPSKSLYLAVHERDSWGNPFLIVGRDTVSLRVVYPDSNPSGFGGGGMLRPASARRQDLDLRLGDLAAALGALPQNAWPYGRVVAIEEGGGAVKADRPQIRRNIEAAIQTLNDLGVVVDEWTGNSGGLLR